MLAREASLDKHREKRYKDFGGGRPKGVVVTDPLTGASGRHPLVASAGCDRSWAERACPGDAALRHGHFIEGGINR